MVQFSLFRAYQSVMASNHFGQHFKITTWGESHGPAMGVVIDGCPAGLQLSVEDINRGLAARAPGRSAHTSPRKEPDVAILYSGVFEGVTTGAPISIVIPNHDADSSKYEAVKHILKPGHANYTYLQKYGVFDYRGGGRASARETACRVAAGVVAEKILSVKGIQTVAYLSQMGEIAMPNHTLSLDALNAAIHTNPFLCPDEATAVAMQGLSETVQAAGDSIGGVVSFHVEGLPAGLGDPVYEKLEANLAKAMLSIPASKGFEIGEGFAAATLRGSQHNDAFTSDAKAPTATNHAGGTLGGISTGMPLLGRVAFKPTSSIKHAQQSVDLSGQATTFTLPEGSRHDPCVAIRAVPVVRAMVNLVLVDALLMQHTTRLEML